MQSIQDTPVYRGTNRFRRPFPQLPIAKQLDLVVEVFGSSAQHRPTTVEWRQRRVRQAICEDAIGLLREKGFDLKSLLGLKPRHIETVVEAWVDGGLAHATIRSRLSVLRWLTRALGKRGLVRAAEAYGLPPEPPRAATSAGADELRAADGRGVEELIAAVAAVNAWAGLVLRLMHAFGLSVTEAILLRPHATDAGAKLVVEEGSRRRRARVVDVRTAAQRAALEAAKAFAKTTTHGNLLPPDFTFEAARRRLYYLCGKAGVASCNGVCLRHLRRLPQAGTSA